MRAINVMTQAIAASAGSARVPTQVGMLGNRKVTTPVESPIDNDLLEQLLLDCVISPLASTPLELQMGSLLLLGQSPLDQSPSPVEKVRAVPSTTLDPIQKSVEKQFQSVMQGNLEHVSHNSGGDVHKVIREAVQHAQKMIEELGGQNAVDANLDACSIVVSDALNKLQKVMQESKSEYPVHPVFLLMHALRLSVKSYESSITGNPIDTAFREVVDTHPLMQSLFSGNEELFREILSKPMLLKAIAQHGPVLVEQAAKDGVAKLSRKSVQGLPFSLIAIRSEDGASISLKITQRTLGQGTYKVAKGFQELSVSSHATNESAKASIHKARAQGSSPDSLLALEKEVESEASIAKKLQKAGAKNVLHARTVKYNNKVHLFSKQCKAGSIEKYIKQRDLPKEHALRLAHEQAKTLEVLHDTCHLCHLDLKLDNIMLDGDPEDPGSLTTRLSDFGTTTATSDSVTTSCTATYPPPEMEYGGDEIPIQPSIDMWSFGVMLHQLYHPNILLRDLAFDFQGTKRQEQLLKTIHASCSKTGDPVDQLIGKLLSVDPKIRPSAHEAAIVLEKARSAFV